MLVGLLVRVFVWLCVIVLFRVCALFVYLFVLVLACFCVCWFARGLAGLLAACVIHVSVVRCVFVGVFVFSCVSAFTD